MVKVRYSKSKTELYNRKINKIHASTSNNQITLPAQYAIYIFQWNGESRMMDVLSK
jgi:hypothetical protein